MSKKGQPRNLAASVHARLLEKAKAENRPYNELFQYYAMERMLYRLSMSRHSKKFILKGALMFTAWEVPMSRPTMDIDLLGRTKNNIDNIVAIIQDICREPVEPDGLHFDPNSVAAAEIVEDAEYGGIRVTVRGRFLANAKVLIQLDIGFGDVIVPSETSTTYPTILDFPAPVLKGYSRESAIAEKFDAMVKRGMTNSRMKDFFDVWFLSRRFKFDGSVASDAIRKTFETRGRLIPKEPVYFSVEFIEAKGQQWRTFLRRGKMKDVPESFGDVVTAISGFLLPMVSTMVEGKNFKGTWTPPGPWMN